MEIKPVSVSIENDSCSFTSIGWLLISNARACLSLDLYQVSGIATTISDIQYDYLLFPSCDASKISLVPNFFLIYTIRDIQAHIFIQSDGKKKLALQVFFHLTSKGQKHKAYFLRSHYSSMSLTKVHPYRKNGLSIEKEL